MYKFPRKPLWQLSGIILLATLCSNKPLWAQAELFGPAKVQTKSNGLLKSIAKVTRSDVRRDNIVSISNPAILEGNSILLNMFQDTKIKISKSLASEENTIKSWIGNIDGDLSSFVIIYYKKDWISGQVTKGGELYTFSTNSDGNVEINEMDVAKISR